MASHLTNKTTWTTCNTTLTDLDINEDPIWRHLTFHHFGLILSAFFGLIAVVLSNILIYLHATHYSKPHIQKHIIRILFMVPIYSIVSFFSYAFFRHALYYEVIRDCYEAFAIASFFALLCHYIAPTLHEQKDYFRGAKPKDWVWPLSWCKRCCPGIWKTPRSGLTWFNVIWFCVFQYCFIRVAMTITSVVTEATGRYCETSLSPVFARVWITLIEAIAVTVAMYCLIQFYIQIKDDVSEHRPFLKILSIKLVIFFSFWQTLVIGLLVSTGALKTSNTINYPDLRIGAPALMLCIEMALFSILHFFAFSYKPYVLPKHPVAGMDWDNAKERYHGGPFGVKAIIDAYNIWDLVKAVGRGFRWMSVGRRNRHNDPSYATGHNDLGLSTVPPQESGVTAFSSGKQGRYQRLDGADDHEGLMGHAAPIAAGSTSALGFEPIRQKPSQTDSGDIGTQSTNYGPDSFTSKHPTPGTIRRDQRESATVADEMSSDSDFHVVHKPRAGGNEFDPAEDTGYHGAAAGTNVPPPPFTIRTNEPQNRPRDTDWDVWDRERDTGGRDPPSYGGKI